MSDSRLYAVDPKQLSPARKLCHAACQWPSLAARANLPPKEDDSHSSLSWHQRHQAFVSHWLTVERREQLGFSFSRRSLIWLEDGVLIDALKLDDLTERRAAEWVEEYLARAQLRSVTAARLPYDLAPLAGYQDFAAMSAHAETLGAWYQHAQLALEALVGTFQSVAVGPPSIRCWPHHFDLAVRLVLEPGEMSTARSIGVGLSPGDEAYAQPYFYCTPWPPPDAALLSAPNRPLFWHTAGFTSMICRAEDLNEGANVDLILIYAATLAQQILSQG